MTALVSFIRCRRISGTATLLRFAASKDFVTADAEYLRRTAQGDHRRHRLRAKPENRKQIAEAIAPANYSTSRSRSLEQVLTGTFADGLGNIKKVPDRIDFDPFPWQSFAVWIMTQMKRWGQVKGDVDYAKAWRKKCILATDTAKLMKEVGLTPPAATTKTFVVMGKTFDPGKPEEYIQSFKIKKAV